MNVLFLAFILVAGMTSSLKAALCTGLTDAQYRTEIVKIVANNIPLENMNRRFECVMIEKAVRYKNDGGGDGSTEDIASRCFLKDLYKDVTRTNWTSHDSPHIKDERIDACYPGQGFAP